MVTANEAKFSCLCPERDHHRGQQNLAFLLPHWIDAQSRAGLVRFSEHRNHGKTTRRKSLVIPDVLLVPNCAKTAKARAGVVIAPLVGHSDDGTLSRD